MDDSLSAIYAHENGAARLLLIKSVDVDTALNRAHSSIPASPLTPPGSTSSSPAPARWMGRMKSSRGAASPALAFSSPVRHERSLHEKSSNAALGLGADRLRPFLHRVPRHDPHAREDDESWQFAHLRVGFQNLPSSNNGVRCVLSDSYVRLVLVDGKNVEDDFGTSDAGGEQLSVGYCTSEELDIGGWGRFEGWVLGEKFGK